MFRSILAAWFHIKLPSKRTKCGLEQFNFSKIFEMYTK